VTLRERLAALFPEASGHRIKRWLASGRVRVNGRMAGDGRISVGAAAAVELGGARGRAAGAVLLGGIRLVHEDDAIVVIDKPAGLLTVATARERERTAHRIVRDLMTSGRPPRALFIVHRLDRDTSGLIVLARSPWAKQHLQAQFAARTAERVYLAVVEGVVRDNQGTLESRLAEDRTLRVRSVRGHAAARRDLAARDAITHFRVVERRRATTLLELTLGTGRRRQIRVQLAEIGHPVAGDREAARTPGKRAARFAGGAPRRRRLLLHAVRLGFVHPGTGEPVRFESPPPPAFGAARSSSPA
jgi:23S rRNA pseudouridine1911/1915/1917 synthase